MEGANDPRAATQALLDAKLAELPLDQCPVCTQVYSASTPALLLPCMDTMCSACVLTELVSDGGLRCPLCLAVHAAPKSADAVEQLLPHPFLGLCATPDVPRCALCDDDVSMENAIATAHCAVCDQELCQAHEIVHGRSKTTKLHTLTSYAKGRRSALDRCAQHSKELEVYCGTCDALVCLACVVDGHPARTHDHYYLKADYVESRRAQLAEAYRAALARSELLKETLTEVQQALAQTVQAEQEVAGKVQEAFAALTALLKEREQALLQMTAVAFEADRRELRESAATLTAEWRASLGPLQLTTELTENRSTVLALVRLAQRLEGRLRSLSAREAPSVTMPPNRKFVLVDDHLSALLSSLGSVHSPAFGPRCSLQSPLPESSSADEPVNAILVCRDHANQPVVDDGDRVEVEGRLRPATVAGHPAEVIDVAAPAAVTARKAGVFVVTVTPKQAGTLELGIRVNGLPIQGSPFTMSIEDGVLFKFLSHTFTNAGAVGCEGPTLGQLQAAYAATVWVHNAAFFSVPTQGVQLWTVPRTAVYTFTVVGAHGAMGTNSTTGARGGRGAHLIGSVRLEKGQRLRFIVGQAGLYDAKNGGGGGASVVFNESVQSLLFVAGGGGGTRHATQCDGCDASLERYGWAPQEHDKGSGTAFVANTDFDYCRAGKAVLGGGGRAAADSYGDGGAGWNGDGHDDAKKSTVAQALKATAVGGGQGQAACGGFGGGGSGHGGSGGGGGGGYTGGNGGHVAGGGGSYIDERVQTAVKQIDDRSYARGGTPVHGFISVTLETEV